MTYRNHQAPQKNKNLVYKVRNKETGKLGKLYNNIGACKSQITKDTKRALGKVKVSTEISRELFCSEYEIVEFELVERKTHEWPKKDEHSS
jgi:hypothetical protein